MDSTQTENRQIRNFGDLYMSIADYSYFESIDFEYTFYLDLLFRQHIYVEESMFFVKDIPFAAFALMPKGHIHAAIREGIIRPLTKEINASSFEELTIRYPHLRFNDPTLRPDTLHEDMIQLSKRYDQMYTGADGCVKVRAISLDEARYYNQDLKTILQQPSPPKFGTSKQMDIFHDMWQKTEKFRFDWVNQVVHQSEAKGLAGDPKTAFNKLGADLMHIPYRDLKQLIEYAPSHPQGEQIIAFLRWVHEIFYYSRSRAINAATTYALISNHITIPFFYSLRNAQGYGEDLSIEHPIKLPTRQAFTKMSSSRLLRVRETEEAADFYQAIISWQVTGTNDDKKNGSLLKRVGKTQFIIDLKLY